MPFKPQPIEDEMLTNKCKEAADLLEELRVSLAQLRHLNSKEKEAFEITMNSLTDLAVKGVWYVDPKEADVIE